MSRISSLLSRLGVALLAYAGFQVEEIMKQQMMRLMVVVVVLGGQWAWGLDLEAEIARQNETTEEISKTLIRDRAPQEDLDLPSLEDDGADDFKVELVPAKRDQT